MIALTSQYDQRSQIYGPLEQGQIRLLKLLPGLPSDSVQAELRNVSIHQPGDYEALSYHWGSLTEGVKLIECDGVALEVTANLFATLKRLRERDDMRILWVDAICIDQSSEQERSSQITMMLEIFNSANLVLMWLGEVETQDYANMKPLFELANIHYNHAVSMDMLKTAPGKMPIVLYCEDSEPLAILREALQQFEQYDSELRADLEAATTMILENPDLEFGTPSCSPLGFQNNGRQLLSDLQAEIIPENPNFLLVGARSPTRTMVADEASLSDSENDTLILEPVLYLDRVRWAASQDFPDFVSFLEAAIWPIEPVLNQHQFILLYKALWDVVCRPYWTGAWIVQEAIVAKQAVVICADLSIDFDALISSFGLTGSSTMPWLSHFFVDDEINIASKEELDQADDPIHQQWLRSCLDTRYRFSKPLRNIMSVSGLRIVAHEEPVTDMTLAILLDRFRYYDATDARDHIFSLVGLLRYLTTSRIEIGWCENVNYTLGIKDVFVSAANQISENYIQRKSQKDSIDEHRPHILDAFWNIESGSHRNGWPTWIPDWSTNAIDFDSFKELRRKEIDTIIEYKASVENNELLISGHLVDEVKFSSGLFISQKGLYEEVSQLVLILEANMGQVYGDPMSQIVAFWRTVIMDGPTHKNPSSQQDHQYQENEMVELWIPICL